jgi:hypothetical protein
MTTIGDLVKMDLQGTLRSDVQLSDYDDPDLNRQLLQHYIFTTRAPDSGGGRVRRLSSLEVFDKLCQAFVIDKLDNRITIIANYGHGKSHLALTLANYFARAASSREVKTILQRLGQAVKSPPELARYRQIKDNRGEFLVVRLRGDSPAGLREQFLKGLENALREHKVTQNAQPPFWYTRAAAALQRLEGNSLERANTFLEQYATDVPDLLQNLQEAGHLDIVRSLFTHLHGIPPDFGGEVGLKEAVRWAVDEWCGPNKPLGGLLILFDEFSLFVQRYARTGPTGDLQDLLNGLSDCQGRAVFVAFSQHDPRTIAAASATGTVLESVNHELSRLPDSSTFALYSLMEGVIDSYLAQSDQQWERWSAEQSVKSYCARARNVTLQHFRRRYEEELRWSLDVFERTVVKGCFPLHPLTTAILSTHRFHAGEDVGTPRTVLGFIQRQMEEKEKQPALVDGQPNCVLPIALVDYYEGRISTQEYDGYRAALDLCAERPSEVTEAHYKVLKALLLQMATQVRATGDEQVGLLTEMSGLTTKATKQALHDLAGWQIIQYDAIRRVSSFLPAHIKDIEGIIRKAVEGIAIDRHLVEQLSQWLEPLDLPVNLGHERDWAASQLFLLAEDFSADALRDVVRRYSATSAGIEAGERGLVIWLVARTDDSKLHLRQHATEILDEYLANQTHPIPVVLVLPMKATPDLLEAFRRYKALHELPDPERQQIGETTYRSEHGRAETTLRIQIAALRGDVEHFQEIPRESLQLVVPAPYRAAVSALPHHSLKAVLLECYRLAYRRPEFYTQYQVAGKGPNKLREAVKKTTSWLLEDRVGTGVSTLPTKDLQRQLCELYLRDKWGLLAAGTFAIQEPTESSLRAAWDFLASQFAPGCRDQPVREMMVALLNPPYGHDFNTLLLLLSAWIGYHQHQLKLARGRRTVSVAQLRDWLNESKGPKEFLDAICCSESPLTMSRSRADEAVREARSVTERIRSGAAFSQAEARDALAQLDQVLSNPRLTAGDSEAIQRARERLAEALTLAETYDTKAAEILRSLEQPTLEALLQKQNAFGDLPHLSSVLAESPPVAELRQQWEEAVSRACETSCGRYERLSDIGDYRAHEGVLKALQRQLHKAGLASLEERTGQALARLGERAEQLRKDAAEKPIVVEIQGMTLSAPLKDLRDYRRRLEALSGLSESADRLRQEKLSQIINRIEQHEQFASQLMPALEDIASASDLDQLRERLLRAHNVYEGTELVVMLDRVKQRADMLREFFTHLADVQRHPLTQPGDALQMHQQLESIGKRFGNTMGVAQKECLQRVRRALDGRVNELIAAAHNWLETKETELERGANPAHLLQATESPPAFLSKVDAQRLRDLRMRAQSQLEQDVLAKIEAMFRQIRDPQRRRDCLKRLQRIADDEG